MFKILARIFFGLSLVALASCAAPRQLGVIQSFEAERKLGEEQLPQFLLSRGGVYSNAELSQYIGGITKRLVATVDVPEPFRPLRVRVLNTSAPSAFALPGGAIFVSRGIIGIANDEAQLAGVIAHEISHVVARHSAKRIAENEKRILEIVREQDQSLRGAPRSRQIAIFEQELEARLGDIASFSKDQELEADRLGLQMVIAAGYDPSGFGELLERIDNFENRRLLRTGVGADELKEIVERSGYPELSERLAALGTFPKTAPDTAGRDRLMQVIDGMTFDDRYQGALVRDGAYWHPVQRLSFKVPPEIVPLHGATFRMVSKHGRIDLRIEDADNVTLDGLVKGLREAETRPFEAKKTAFNGFPAIVSRIKFNQARDEFVSEIAIIDLGRRFAIFGLLTKPEDESKIRPYFSEVLNSVRKTSLTEVPKRRRYETRRIRSGDSVTSLLDESTFGEDGEAQLRLLNGLEEGQLPAVGNWIKLVD